MKIGGLIQVKNEVKKIEQCIRYHLEIGGFDHIIVTDNNSYDGTYEKLQSLDDPRVTVYCTQTGIGFNQEYASTDMALELFNKHGCEWVFPIDSDELWHSPAYGTVKNALANLPYEVDVLQTYQFDFIETALDEQNELNFVRRMKYARVNNLVNKVVLHNLGGKLEQLYFGNHGLGLKGGESFRQAHASHLALVKYHYPNPGKAEMIRRILNQVEGFVIRTGGEWLRNHQGVGIHIHNFYNMLRNGTFDKHYRGNFYLSAVDVKRSIEAGEVMYLEDMMDFFPKNTTSEDFVLNIPPLREKISDLDLSILWLEGRK
ncbi:glycosyltransferase family 2 protein [bacterium]|nr:glycosyltransferase family 2 protein [bacterium]